MQSSLKVSDNDWNDYLKYTINSKDVFYIGYYLSEASNELEEISKEISGKLMKYKFFSLSSHFNLELVIRPDGKGHQAFKFNGNRIYLENLENDIKKFKGKIQIYLRYAEYGENERGIKKIELTERNKK